MAASSSSSDSLLKFVAAANATVADLQVFLGLLRRIGIDLPGFVRSSASRR